RALRCHGPDGVLRPRGRGADPLRAVPPDREPLDDPDAGFGGLRLARARLVRAPARMLRQRGGPDLPPDGGRELPDLGLGDRLQRVPDVLNGDDAPRDPGLRELAGDARGALPAGRGGADRWDR